MEEIVVCPPNYTESTSSVEEVIVCPPNSTKSISSMEGIAVRPPNYTKVYFQWKKLSSTRLHKKYIPYRVSCCLPTKHH